MGKQSHVHPSAPRRGFSYQAALEEVGVPSSPLALGLQVQHVPPSEPGRREAGRTQATVRHQRYRELLPARAHAQGHRGRAEIACRGPTNAAPRRCLGSQARELQGSPRPGSGARAFPWWKQTEGQRQRPELATACTVLHLLTGRLFGRVPSVLPGLIAEVVLNANFRRRALLPSPLCMREGAKKTAADSPGPTKR